MKFSEKHPVFTNHEMELMRGLLHRRFGLVA